MYYHPESQNDAGQCQALSAMFGDMYEAIYIYFQMDHLSMKGYGCITILRVKMMQGNVRP